MIPLVVDYLKTHTFQQLEDEHGVCVKYATGENVASLNYDQILVKPNDPLAEECRGMVVRTFDNVDPQNVNWKDVIVGRIELLAWPMNRFYNIGDPACVQINLSDIDTYVCEKLDGTMIVFYHDALSKQSIMGWNCATRSVPRADIPIQNDHIQIKDTTFSGLFWTALEKAYINSLHECDEYDFNNWLDTAFDKNVTYVFELTSQYNRVVVKYNDTNVTLIATRRLDTGEEFICHEKLLDFIPRPKIWNISSMNDLESFVQSADPSLLEGAVIYNAKFERAKLKNKAWVLSSRAKDLVTVSRRAGLLAIIKGEVDDILPIVDEDIAHKLRDMQEKLIKYAAQIDEQFLDFKIHAGNDRKTFAHMVMASQDWSSPYFNMWENKSSSTLMFIKNAAENGRLSSSILDNILKKINIAC